MALNLIDGTLAHRYYNAKGGKLLNKDMVSLIPLLVES